MDTIGKRRYSVLSFSKILFAFCFVFIRESPANPISNGDQSAMQYLEKYGYMAKPEDGTSSLVTSDIVVNAVKEFQMFAGLQQTGTLDDVTIEMMNKPRCGMKDVQKNQRRKRFALQGSKWKTTRLTYRISKYPSKILSREYVYEIIGKAFKAWSDVSDLSFVERETGRVNIDIRFEKRNHGKQCEKFDGPGYVLAHAFYPNFGGQVHFDDEEDWSLGGSNGINLMQVAVHEIGHSLGLDHSKQKKAVMAPFYDFKPAFSLNQDDVTGIQMIYGAGSHNDLCRDSSIQAAAMLQNGEFYVFKGESYWRILLNGIAQGYPRRITDDWYGLPGDLDAAFTGPSGSTYFFKGDQYWRFQNRKLDSGYPRTIQSGFPKIPDNIDAAVVWNGNNKVYFFKGNVYWQFDQDVEESVKDFYPLAISQYWPGLPDNIDAAFLAHDNKTYFFKGDKYYRFHEDKVDVADPPYPRSTSNYWFGCPTEDERSTEEQLQAVNIINPYSIL